MHSSWIWLLLILVKNKTYSCDTPLKYNHITSISQFEKLLVPGTTQVVIIRNKRFGSGRFEVCWRNGMTVFAMKFWQAGNHAWTRVWPSGWSNGYDQDLWLYQESHGHIETSSTQYVARVWYYYFYLRFCKGSKIHQRRQWKGMIPEARLLDYVFTFKTSSCNR